MTFRPITPQEQADFLATEEDATALLEDDQLEELDQEAAPQSNFRPIQPEDVEEERGLFQSVGREALGLGENILSVITGFGADVAGGIGATAKTITSGPQAGEDTLRQFQKAFTFEPRTEEGQRNILKLGKAINDVVELDKQDPIPIVHQMRQIFGSEDNAVGNFMADVARQTGSPTLEAFAGAFGATLGPGALEILGFKGAGKLARGAGMRKKKASDAVAFKELQQAMPSPEKYLQTAKGVFKETDAAGATIKATQMPNLARSIRERLAEGGYRPDVNPIEPIERTLRILDSGQPLSTADMRELGKAMAKMGENGSHQQALGLSMSSGFDDFMARQGVLDLPPGTSPEIAESYRIARKMYGQGKRTQHMNKMVEFANSEGKDFIQTMNTQLNALSKDQIFRRGVGQFFTNADRKIIQNMMADTRGQKWLQNISKLSPFRSNAGGLAQMLATIGGVGTGVGAESIAAGTIVAGLPLALGEGARIWGEAIFKGKIKLGTALLQAGQRGKRIARAYVENIPKNQRTPQELGQLISDPRIDLKDMPKTKFTLEAMRIADQIRKEKLAAGAVAASSGLVDQENNQ